VRLARTHADTLREADQLGREGWVYYLEDMRGENVAISSMPLDVGPILADSLWARLPRVAAMSATLTVGGRFDHVAHELGVEDARELAVPTPFDMKRQALLVIPATMPLPNAREFGDEVAEHVAQAVQAAHGRTLALFTSFRVLEKAHARLSGCGYRVLRQGEAPRTQLLAEFKRDTSSVLLGTASFWEGVDAPGEACSCVVIDRLPFPTPDDPLIDAVAEQDPRAWFSKWSLPRAVIAFRQGFGRLIRGVDDRGCVVLLDRRVVAKSYGTTFLRSLGGVPVRHEMAAVGEFLAATKV
jgi:ATP-dependent DNA helicase DinG